MASGSAVAVAHEKHDTIDPFQSIQRGLNRHAQCVLIYPQRAYGQLPLARLTREAIELAAAARRKALGQIRRLEKSFLTPL